MNAAPSASAFRVFSYHGLTIAVSSSNAGHLIWLEEFLSPQFEVSQRSSHDCRISLVCDTQRYDEILARGPRLDGGQAVCFVLDTGLVQLPLWKSPTSDRIIFDERLKTFYLVSTSDARIDLLTPAGNLAARTALMRVVRELAMSHSHRTGRLVIHGAAFVVGNTGVIIAGPKGAGKTTLLVHALHQAGVDYVSNDRVVVSNETEGPMARGMPTIVRLSTGTVEMFPHLLPRLRARSYHHRLTLSEIAQKHVGSATPLPRERLSLSPAQFCELLQVHPAAEGELRALVFPIVTGNRGTVDLTRVSPPAAAVRLAESLLHARAPHRVSDVFDVAAGGSCADGVGLEKLSLRLASHVRCFECRLGQEAYHDAAAAAGLIGHVMN